MSAISQNTPKYYINWTPVGEAVPFDAEDFATFQSPVEIIAGKHGKSFCFHAVAAGYKVFIPADSSVTEPIGARIPLERLRLQTLKKEGKEDIQRVKVVPASVI